jgi:NTE family protein
VHRRRAGHRRDLRARVVASPATRKPRIGLALGSGSARGWAHLGAIRALEQHGVKFDMICGTSIGALVGAVYAAGQLERLESWVSGLVRREVVRLMDLTWKGGLIRGQRLFDLFRTMFQDINVDALSVPFGAVATELESGREIWLRHGNLFDVVRASIAAPGVFTPVVLDGRLLVDGGLVNPVPVSMCRALGADIVVAIDLSWGKLGPYRDRRRDVAPQRPESKGLLARLLRGERRDPERPHVPSIFEVFNTALDIVEQRVARSRLSGEPADVLITPLLPNFGAMEYHRGKEAIAEGRAAVERMAPLIEQVIR